MTGLNPDMRFGKKVLMCLKPPKIYWEDPEKNPHMKMERQPDAGKSLSQLGQLLHLYEFFGIEVHYLNPHHGLGDQVFTANITYGMEETFVMANMAVKHRRAEVPIAARWLVDHRYNVCFLPEQDKFGNRIYYEGQANWISTPREHFYCYGIRNSLNAVEAVKNILNLKKPIKPLCLTTSVFYDGDLALRYFPHIDSLMYCPDAFDEPSLEVIRASRPPGQRMEVLRDFAIQDLGNFGKNFALNGVYFNDAVTFPWSEEAERFPREIRSWVEKNGCEVLLINFGEFGKSGGGHKCVSLFLN